MDLLLRLWWLEVTYHTSLSTCSAWFRIIAFCFRLTTLTASLIRQSVKQSTPNNSPETFAAPSFEPEQTSPAGMALLREHFHTSEVVDSLGNCILEACDEAA